MKRILFITSTRIGDAVLTTGLLAHLAESHPDCRITVACGEIPAPLFAAMPGVVRVIPMRKARFALHWLSLWLRCVTSWWFLVVDLRGSGVAWFLPALRRRVFRGRRRGRNRNVDIHRVCEVAAVLGLKDPPSPGIRVSPAHMETAARLVPDGKPEDGPGRNPVLAVGPTANWVGKQWRAENFIALIRRLTAAAGILPGARVAVFGAADERAVATPVIESIPLERRIDLVGQVDLPTAYGCLERCAMYIGNDSGLMHMAAAAGIPTLGLFGPSEDRHYAPWGPRAAVLRTEKSLAELCQYPGFDWNDTDTLMDSLTVDTALEAAEDLWRRCAGERSAFLAVS